MSAEAALIAALKAAPGVAALAAGRVFVFGGRQGTAYPYVTVQRVATAGAEHLGGAPTLEWPTLQIDCWASDGGALQALSLAEAIRNAIDQVDGLAMYATFQDQRGPAPDEETRNFRVSQDYHVFIERN